MPTTQKQASVRKLAVIGMMSALSFVLMLLEFATPLTPEFLKFDFSDLPAFLTAYSLGPVAGAAVEFFKNLLHLFFTHTMGVGEAANFLIGTALVFPAGLIYRYKKTRAGALLGAAAGSLFATLISFPVNYFITYPFYEVFMSFPREAIVGMYHAIFRGITSLPRALLFVNCPFTLIKGGINTLLTFLLYKRLSPILKGTSGRK